jgi:hypothetical protein
MVHVRDQGVVFRELLAHDVAGPGPRRELLVAHGQ